MAAFTFVPEVQTVGSVTPVRSVAELDAEVSVFAASPEFVRTHCGPVANEFLDAVSPAWFARCDELGLLPNIDVRVHRLNVGEFPAVPGWHCDGVLRETYHSQPDLERVRIRDTVIGFVGSDVSGVSCTEYVSEPFTVSLPSFDEQAGSGSRGYALWRDVHTQLENARPRPASAVLPPGVLVCMSASTLHRAVPASVRGWRLFFRMSMWHNDYLGEQGKVARQQQVYLLSEANGW